MHGRISDKLWTQIEYVINRLSHVYPKLQYVTCGWSEVDPVTRAPKFTHTIIQDPRENNNIRMAAWKVSPLIKDIIRYFERRKVFVPVDVNSEEIQIQMALGTFPENYLITHTIDHTKLDELVKKLRL